MSPVWAVPVLVLTVGAVGLAALVRGTATSARELATELARFGELHVALIKVGDELDHGRSVVRDLRER